MESRLKFRSGEQKTFLLLVQKTSGKSNKQLAMLAGVVDRSYRDWKRENLCMSLTATELFCKLYKVDLPESKEVLVRRWKDHKKQAGRKGGLACYAKYGDFATKYGRMRGGLRALKVLRERGVIPYAKEFNFPTGYSEKLAEFVGMMLGDGGITRSQACITLNSIADKEYLIYVKNLIQELFDFEPSTLKRVNYNAVEVYCNGIKFVDYLVKIGLKIENKVKQQVGAPSRIWENMAFRKACLRGLMDTDGGVFKHRCKVNNKKYENLKICFSNRSLPILEFVRKTLEELDFTPKIILNNENKKVWLYNQDEVLQYLSTVGTSNQRLLKHMEASDSGPFQKFAKLRP